MSIGTPRKKKTVGYMGTTWTEGKHQGQLRKSIRYWKTVRNGKVLMVYISEGHWRWKGWTVPGGRNMTEKKGSCCTRQQCMREALAWANIWRGADR